MSARGGPSLWVVSGYGMLKSCGHKRGHDRQNSRLYEESDHLAGPLRLTGRLVPFHLSIDREVHELHEEWLVG